MADVSATRTAVTTFLSSLPSQGVASVVFDIGASLDPILPPIDNASVASLAFEPVHYESIRLQQNGNPRLHISPAAVAAEDGVAEMGIYHNSRAASSLSAAPERAMNHNPEKALDVLIAEGLGQKLKNAEAERRARGILEELKLAHSKATNGAQRTTAKVPALSLRTVIDALPASVELWFLKIGMQGHDFAAVKGAGDALRRVQWMKTRVQVEGVENGFCDDFFPYLTKLGFDLVELAVENHHPSSIRPLAAGNDGGRAYCDKPKAKRHGHGTIDAFWVNRDGQRWHPPRWDTLSSHTGPLVRWWHRQKCAPLTGTLAVDEKLVRGPMCL